MVRLGVSGSGYETCHDRESGDWFYVHRLAAVAEYGVEAVKHRDVHHLDGCDWNNSRDNLKPVPPGRHRGWNLPDGSRPKAKANGSRRPRRGVSGSNPDDPLPSTPRHRAGGEVEGQTTGATNP